MHIIHEAPYSNLDFITGSWFEVSIFWYITNDIQSAQLVVNPVFNEGLWIYMLADVKTCFF